MEYEKESFTVPMQRPGVEKTFAENWDRIFGNKAHGEKPQAHDKEAEKSIADALTKEAEDAGLEY